MGVLLSKGAQTRQEDANSREWGELSVYTKQRHSQNEGIAKPPRKRRKSTKLNHTLSSHFGTPPRDVTLESCTDKDDQIRLNPKSGRRQPLGNSHPGAKLQAPLQKSPRKRKPRTTSPVYIIESGRDPLIIKKTSFPTPGHSDTTLHSVETTPTTKPRAKRKRKEITSPYFGFDLPPTQLSSPPATPTPSIRSRDRKSKVSVIETSNIPSSLPHFRPTSSNEFGLIQEKLRHEPWKMLVAVILLNVTTGKLAIPLVGQLFERWPTPEVLSQANFDELSAFLYPIGLYNIRAKRLIEFSTLWLSNPPCHDLLTKRKSLPKYPPTAISHLPGMGVYALDSWRMFCAGKDEWRNVQPLDKELQAWMRWRWARDGKPIDEM